MKRKQMNLIILFLLILISCQNNSTSSKDIAYMYKIPIQTDDGWEIASLTGVGMDEILITQFMDELLNNIEHMIHSILIIKDGKLVFEEYFPGYAFYQGPYTEFDRETKHNIASITKSVTSALIGLAIDQDFIQDVNQKVFSFFPEYNDLSNDEKDGITIEHLLTMTSGLEWDESTYPYSDSRNDVYHLFHQNDPIRYILTKPVAVEPGTEFLYSSGSANVLGEIIRKTSGLRADDFASEYLFSRLEITDYQWVELSENVLFTSGDLKLRPRDMAKLGYLYLNDGVWKEQQIISEWWIEASTKSFIKASTDFDYGYKWWLHTYETNSVQIESFSAQGWGGQYIIVFPSLDMIVVTTAGYYDEPELEYHIDVLLMQNILSSVKNIISSKIEIKLKKEKNNEESNIFSPSDISVRTVSELFTNDRLPKR